MMWVKWDEDIELHKFGNDGLTGNFLICTSTHKHQILVYFSECCANFLKQKEASIENHQTKAFIVRVIGAFAMTLREEDQTKIPVRFAHDLFHFPLGFKQVLAPGEMKNPS